MAINEGTLSAALEEIHARIAELESERAGLDRLLAAAHEEEQLLVQYMALRTGRVTQADVTKIAEPAHARNCREPKQPSVEAVVRELAAAGRPLHISDLMRLLRDANVQIPGAGAQANLITHLRRDDRLIRPSRGMYALTAWGLPSMPSKPSRKRRKRRVVSTSKQRTET